MKEIMILEYVYGYRFELSNGQIKYVQEEDIPINKEEVQFLLQEIQKKKSNSIDYLTNRSQPVDIADHLWQASEKAEYSARNAMRHKDEQFALKELQRTARLASAAAKASGAIDPHVPWKEWVSSFNT